MTPRCPSSPNPFSGDLWRSTRDRWPENAKDLR